MDDEPEMSEDTVAGDVVTVRPERPGDEDAIAELVEAAFGSPAQARLVRAIRSSEEYIPELALVAELGRRVVGHVMISEASLQDGDERHRVVTLSPLAVAPDVHGKGVGAALVREVLARADQRGEPLVVLEGNPTFYGRFGFEHSVPHGIRIDLPRWAPAAAAQVLCLSHYDPAIRGRVVYPPAFSDVTDG